VRQPAYSSLLRSVRKVKRSLNSLRTAGDVRGVIGVLDVCLKPNFAGVERVRLYSETFYGTKDLVEGYIDEVSQALQFVRESQEATLEEKKRFFKSANKVSSAVTRSRLTREKEEV
jgi:hypothetical protein